MPRFLTALTFAPTAITHINRDERNPLADTFHINADRVIGVEVVDGDPLEGGATVIARLGPHERIEWTFAHAHHAGQWAAILIK